MKAAARLVVMYLMLAVCLGMVSLYVGCVQSRQQVRRMAAPPSAEVRSFTRGF